MLKPRSKTDLPEKPVTAEAQGELGVQRLERDRTIVPEIPCEVHRRHPASPELVLDGVAVAQGTPQLFGLSWHDRVRGRVAECRTIRTSWRRCQRQERSRPSTVRTSKSPWFSAY